MNQMMHILTEDFFISFIPQGTYAGRVAKRAATFKVYSKNGLSGRVE
jgi:hypothetical protein